MSGFLFPTSRDRDYEVSKFDTLVTGAVDLPAKSVSGFKFDCRDFVFRLDGMSCTTILACILGNSSETHGLPGRESPKGYGNGRPTVDAGGRPLPYPAMSGLVFLTNRIRDCDVSKFDTLLTVVVDIDPKSRLGSYSPCQNSVICHYPFRPEPCSSSQEA